ncbi:LGFP repeat-containing protein [Homoserinimonas sp. A447]
MAANGADFNPNHIISDADFYNGNAMTEAEIQAFLAAKGSGLATYRSDVTSRPARPSVDIPGLVYCEAFQGGTSLLASTIVFRAQKACNVSAKVLLVTMQKEQGLILKSSFGNEVLAAMGYGCPDTAACNETHYGLGNQLYMASLQFRFYQQRFNNFRYQVGSEYVAYSTDPACGGSTLNIQSWATAALYNYTPYQPNAAAIAAYPGTAPCGSYGNRNFWFFYTDWFGPIGFSGTIKIDEAYARWGGAAGALGAAVGEPASIAANGGGLVQAYENGAIAWSQSRGAFPVMGEIRAYFGSEGGIGGRFGWPATDPNSVAVHGGGVVQGFAGGAITSTAENGTHSLTGAMRTYFSTTGGLAGVLGWPSGEQTCGAGYCTQSFTGGTTYLRGSVGRYLTPAVHDSYSANGGPTGHLGFPLTDPIQFSSNGGGIVQAFEAGAIAGPSDGAAWPLTGNLRASYNAAGGTTGALGWPVGEGSCAADGECSQPFQAGMAYWSQTRGSAYTAGTIAKAYESLGGPSGSLGWPTTGIIGFAANGGGQVQGFTNGALASSLAGAHVVTGDIRAYYNAIGGTAGVLGWPKASQACGDGLCSQVFQNGQVFWSATKGGAYSVGEIASAYVSQGGPGSSIGWPVTGIIAFSANGGGTVQGFENAAFASSAAGTFALSGGVREFYNSVGGTIGALGWPTGIMSCVADLCTQTFQNGTIEHSAASGGRIL